MDHPTRPIASLQALPPCEPLTGVLSLPPRLRPGAPLLCFLHGRGEAQPEAAPATLSRHGPLYPLSALDAPFEQDGAAGFVVVAPQLPVAGDHWHEHADRVRRLVEEVEAHHDTDPSRRYLTGFSFGGNGVFDLGHRQAGFWAALWAVDPTRLPDPDLQPPLWLSLGSSARPKAAAAIARLGSVEVAIEDDGLPPSCGSRVHVDQGEDHVGCARRAYADARIYRWLLGHRALGSVSDGLAADGG